MFGGEIMTCLTHALPAEICRLSKATVVQDIKHVFSYVGGVAERMNGP